jgi:Mg-chelatase subunit ChlD
MLTYYALNPVEGGRVCIGDPQADQENWTQIHGIAETTPGAIIEMGWLSGDLAFMTSTEGQEKMSRGLANGILNFLGQGSSLSASSATILDIDVSGSMDSQWQGGIKIESAKSAAQQIINMMEQESQASGAEHRVGVVTFTDYASLLLGLTSDYNQARGIINALEPKEMTNIGAGLTESNAALHQAGQQETKIIILLSDGLSNRGLTPDEIIAGPVQEAARAGTCIYTVGFGDQNELDEDLLRRIAAASGCGEYYYATDISALERVYVRIRHLAVGDMLGEFSGTIHQDELVDAGTFDVPTGQDQLAVTLHWPGSKLQLRLIDPGGKEIMANEPNVSIVEYKNLIYALILHPMPGVWRLGVFGLDVPQGITDFDAIASSRTGLFTPTPIPQPTATPRPLPSPQTSSGFSIALVMLLLAGGGMGIYVYTIRRRRQGKIPVKTKAGLVVTGRATIEILRGPEAGKSLTIGADPVTLGRGTACTFQIADPGISRVHCVIRPAQGRYYLQDQNSTSGTFVNGQQVRAVPLNPGDLIRLGSTELIFRTVK